MLHHLQSVLETEWKQRSILPVPRSSPPPSSAQKQHAELVSKKPVAAASFTPVAAAGTATTTAVAAAPVITATSKPSAPQSKSPNRQLSQDIEIDVGGSPEPESVDVGDEVARDGDSDAIVTQLEKGLPRWEGPGDYGWMTEGFEDRWGEIMTAIKSHKDVM
jgi:chromatin structure-remodeling complex subunit RSC1/2